MKLGDLVQFIPAGDSFLTGIVVEIKPSGDAVVFYTKAGHTVTYNLIQVAQHLRILNSP